MRFCPHRDPDPLSLFLLLCVIEFMIDPLSRQMEEGVCMSAWVRLYQRQLPLALWFWPDYSDIQTHAHGYLLCQFYYFSLSRF